MHDESQELRSRSVFDRYNIVSSGDLLSAAAQLNGLTGTKQGQSGTISPSSESETSDIANVKSHHTGDIFSSPL